MNAFAEGLTQRNVTLSPSPIRDKGEGGVGEWRRTSLTGVIIRKDRWLFIGWPPHPTPLIHFLFFFGITPSTPPLGSKFVSDFHIWTEWCNDNFLLNFITSNSKRKRLYVSMSWRNCQYLKANVTVACVRTLKSCTIFFFFFVLYNTIRRVTDSVMMWRGGNITKSLFSGGLYEGYERVDEATAEWMEYE